MNYIFRIGSCRTNYILNDKKIKFETNKPIFCHTTKEIIQKIEYLSDIKTVEPLYKDVVDEIENENDKKNFKKASVILIEISSLKEMNDTNGYYYNINRLSKYIDEKKIDGKNTISTKYATLDSLMEDINKIKKIINKPIIFQGHINLLFNNIRIENREIIDESLKLNSSDIIIYEDVFKNDKIENICTFTNDKIDSNHLTQYGYDKLYDKFIEIYNKIKST